MRLESLLTTANWLGKPCLWALCLAMILWFGGTGVRAQSAYCVRANAVGSNDGSDWQNAFTSLPTKLERGFTYYVADGNYHPSGYTFDDNESGLLYITVKKATKQEHGTDLGWVDSMGDGEAVFGGLLIEDGYLIWDGVTGGGPGNWKSGHGFKLTADYTSLIKFTTAVSHVTISHTEFAFPTSEVEDSEAADHIYGTSSVDHFTLEYCYLHDSSRVFILSRGWKDVLVQYNCFARNRSTPGKHAEAWSDHNGLRYVIRHNLFEDIEGTGVIVMLNGSAYNWSIYGNVVYWTGNSNYTGTGGNGVFCTRSENAYAYNWVIYNNTVANQPSTALNVTHRLYHGSGNIQRNNVWYNCHLLTTFGEADVDYHLYINSDDPASIGQHDVVWDGALDPFINAAGMDFRLEQSSPPGVPVSRSAMDPWGRIRGRDGAWDRGAYEFEASGMVPSSPPVNLRVIPK